MYTTNKFVIVFCLMFFSFGVFAKKFQGYIINNHMDTIHGEIRLHKWSFTTGYFIIKGYELETLHILVEFREHNRGEYKSYDAEKLFGFGVKYKGKELTYRSTDVDYKSIIKGEQQRTRFLQILYDGQLILYKDVVHVENPLAKSKGDLYKTYNIYYLGKCKSQDIKRMEINNQIVSVRDLLLKLNIESEFINSISENITLKNFTKVLEDYDVWKLSKSKVHGV